MNQEAGRALLNSSENELPAMLTTNIEKAPGRAPVPKSAGAKDSGRNTRRKPKILVVEDEIFVAWHLESVLRDLDYAVCGLVPDGESAIVKADALAADVILMDINLKGDIDGIETARRIRQGGEAPIIFITAYSDPQTLSRIEKIIPGAAVLAKPVSPIRLRGAIERALGLRKNH